jgi:hypothetical protein
MSYNEEVAGQCMQEFIYFGGDRLTLNSSVVEELSCTGPEMYGSSRCYP